MKFRHYLLLVATMLFASCSAADETKAETPAHPTAINSQTMNITIDGVTHAASLTDNAATNALVEKLRQGPVTVSLNTNGNFEIWGSLGFSLPTSDEYINGQPGDVVLYNGSNICIFYGNNSYSYTRLGKIEGLSAAELKAFLKGGQSNISVTLSLPSGATAIHNIRQATEDDAHYTLNGFKTTRPTHGIYIRNGKKIVL